MRPNRLSRRPEEELDKAKKVADAAQTELRKAKAGSPPPCLFEPGQGNQIRGASVALGSVYINESGIRVIDVNTNIPSIDAVDFLGRKVDYAIEAYNEIVSWPRDRAMDIRRIRCTRSEN